MTSLSGIAQLFEPLPPTPHLFGTVNSMFFKIEVFLVITTFLVWCAGVAVCRRLLVVSIGLLAVCSRLLVVYGRLWLLAVGLWSFVVGACFSNYVEKIRS